MKDVVVKMAFQVRLVLLLPFIPSEEEEEARKRLSVKIGPTNC